MISASTSHTANNADTSAEAQAFKRACACFGLGRYLYYMDGVWVDPDQRKQPKTALKLFGWPHLKDGARVCVLSW